MFVPRMSWQVATLTALFTAGYMARFTTAQEDAASSVSAEIATIANEHQALENRFHEELRAAKRDNEKVRKANDDYYKSAAEMSKRLKALLKQHSQQPAFFDGVLVLVGQMRHPLDDEVTREVLDNHLSNPQMGKLTAHLRYRGGEDWAERILVAASERHPSREIRGQASLALADACLNQILVRSHSPKIAAEQKSRLQSQATHLYEKLVAEHADTPTTDGKSTLGAKARRELTRLKNLPSLVVGGTAPPIAGHDLAGQDMKLSEFRGKVVLLVFWGSWCGPCMAMVPHERELFEKHKDQPFALLGVNCGDAREQAITTAKGNRMVWRSWWDGDESYGPIQTEYDVPHWPRIFLIDAQGIIRGIDQYGEELDKAIEAALKDV